MITGIFAVHPRLPLVMDMTVMAGRRPIAIAAAGHVAVGAYRCLIRRKAVMRGRSMSPGRIRRFAARGGVIMTAHAFGYYFRIVMA